MSQGGCSKIVLLAGFRKSAPGLSMSIAAQFFDLYYIYFCWYYSFDAHCVNENEENKFIWHNLNIFLI